MTARCLVAAGVSNANVRFSNEKRGHERASHDTIAHDVMPLMEGHHPLVGGRRINLTFRKWFN